MINQKCPKCKHQSLRFRDSFKTYICDNCKVEFNQEMNEIEKGTMTDNLGNKYKIEISKEEEKIIVKKIYFLEKGKTTLKTEHSKLKKDSECKYPERLSCNYGEGFERCPFMKYDNFSNIWICN